MYVDVSVHPFAFLCDIGAAATAQVSRTVLPPNRHAREVECYVAGKRDSGPVEESANTHPCS